jgi:prepilin-type N-terminal cleavage/methylation domain-containing protein
MALTAKKAVKVTMRIFSAPMQTNCVEHMQYGFRNTQSCPRAKRRDAIRNTRAGFTLTELIVVIVIFSLFILLAQINVFGLLRKNTFKGQVQDFISTMQMAANAAAESNRRYEVIIDLTEQSYLLRQITSSDLSVVLEEELIAKNNFSSNCRVVYVEFDDGDYTNEGRAKFRVGHSGWHYGGKIILLDNDEKPYSIVVNRLNRTIELKEGNVELLVPKAKDEVLF